MFNNFVFILIISGVCLTQPTISQALPPVPIQNQLESAGDGEKDKSDGLEYDRLKQELEALLEELKKKEKAFRGKLEREVLPQIRQELEDFSKLRGGITMDTEGPLWYRGWAKESEAVLENHLEREFFQNGLHLFPQIR